MHFKCIYLDILGQHKRKKEEIQVRIVLTIYLQNIQNLIRLFLLAIIILKFRLTLAVLLEVVHDRFCFLDRGTGSHGQSIELGQFVVIFTLTAFAVISCY